MSDMIIDDVIVIEINDAELNDIINGSGLEFELLGESVKLVWRKEDED